MTSESLHDAIFGNDIRRLMEILASDPGPPQTDLNDALNYALLPNGDERAVAPLLSHGAQITISVFKTASGRDDTFALQAFHDHGWDVNSTEFGEPMLRIAVASEAQIQWLLEHGADPNIRNNKGVSPLATACLEPSTKVPELLISHGAELDPHALFKAMSPRGNGGVPIMTFLIDHGIDVNVKEKPWGSALQYAVTLGDLAKVEVLVRAGADRNVVSVHGMTPAEVAEKRGLVKIFEALSG